MSLIFIPYAPNIMPRHLKALCILLISFNTFALITTDARAEFEHSLEEAQTLIKEGQDSQLKVDETIRETESLKQNFKVASAQLEQINVNLSHQTKLLQSQAQEILSLNKQINEVSNTENGVVPLILEMIQWLENHIKQDLPFHQNERLARLSGLQNKVLDPTYPLAETYRAVLDAYQIESEFGYSIESYQDTLTQREEAAKQVKILRIGRLGLYYLSLDGATGGFWDQQTRSWESADSETVTQIENGILIANKQSPYQLLTLPVTQTGAP